MDIQYETKRDKELLRQARLVFGDVVVDAFVAGYVYDDPRLKEDTDKEMQTMMQQKKGFNGLIDFATGCTVIVFSNQKRVMFNVSEWLIVSSFTGKLQGE